MAKYMIIAYQDEKGLSFNTIKESQHGYDIGGLLDLRIVKWFLILLPLWTLWSIQAQIILIFLVVIGGIPLFLWISCDLKNHEDALTPLISTLASTVQEKFIQKNKDNYHYLKHPMYDSWEKYDYVTKDESIKIIQDVLGCTLKQDTNNLNVYTAKCMTKDYIPYTYTVEGYDNESSTFDIELQKDNTYCYVNFNTRNLIDFKDKSEGKNAGYEGYCSVSSCIQISH